MCGIVGLIKPRRTSSRGVDKLFNELLFAGTFRGVDSTGVFTVTDAYKEPVVFKKAVMAPDFLQLRSSQLAIDEFGDAGSLAIIGHNRAATRGSVSSDNAHPFQHGDVTMVHNGTLISRATLPTPMHQLEVDSMSVAYNLDEEGVEATIKGLHGSFALVWHNAQDGSVNMIRNAERPLAVAALKEGGYAIASEKAMLRWILERNACEVSQWWEPKVGRLFSFRHNKKGSVSITDKALELYTPPTKTISYGSDWRRTLGNPSAPFQGAAYTPQPKVTTLSKEAVERGKNCCELTGFNDGQHILAYFESISTRNIEANTEVTVKLTAYSQRLGNLITMYCHNVKKDIAVHWNSTSKEYPAALVHIRAMFPLVTGPTEVPVGAVSIVRLLQDCEVTAMEEVSFPGAMGTTASIELIPEEPIKEDADEKLVPFFEDELLSDILVLGPDHRYIPEREFKDKVGAGCSGCTQVMEKEDALEIEWVNGFPFCAECTNDGTLAECLGLKMRGYN